MEIKTDDNIETSVIDSIWSEKLIEKIREAIKKKWKKTIDQDRAIIIFEQRILNDQDTLDNLGIKYNVSRERIRQVEKTIISIIKDVLHKGNFLTGTSYENYTEPLETHKKSKTTKVNTST
ncbi:MAG: hypothetical protein ACD_79C00957G0002 [uncultured bacterium]|nr:MAG: hypothetical protein ACD_79C00957G0002 [uncultured bacterium]